jgi:hypothetical protein
LRDPFGQPHQDRVRLSVTRGQVLRVHLHAVLAGERAGVAYLRLDDEPARIGQPGTGSIDESWTLTSSTIGPHPNPTVVALGVALAPPGAPAPSSLTGDWYECRLEARTTSDGATETLTPCDGWYHYVFPHGATATVRVDLSQLLVVSVSRP